MAVQYYIFASIIFSKLKDEFNLQKVNLYLTISVDAQLAQRLYYNYSLYR